MILKLKNWVVFLIIFVLPPLIVYGLNLSDIDFSTKDFFISFQLTMILMSVFWMGYLAYLNIQLSRLAKKRMVFSKLSVAVLFGIFIFNSWNTPLGFNIDPGRPSPTLGFMVQLFLGLVSIFYMFINISQCLNEISFQKRPIVIRVLDLWILPIGIWSIQKELNKL